MLLVSCPCPCLRQSNSGCLLTRRVAPLHCRTHTPSPSLESCACPTQVHCRSTTVVDCSESSNVTCHVTVQSHATRRRRRCIPGILPESSPKPPKPCEQAHKLPAFNSKVLERRRICELCQNNAAMSDGVDLSALDALHAAGQFDQVFVGLLFWVLCASSLEGLNCFHIRLWPAAPNAFRQTVGMWNA